MPAQKELSAGGIVVRKHNNKWDVLLIKDHRHRWTFPKGHVEDGEDVPVAAARETEEETGLVNLKVGERVGSVNYFFKDKWGNGGGLINKTVEYFLLFAPAHAEPQPPRDWTKGTEPIADAKWVPIAEADEISGYKDNLKLLKKTRQLLSHHQKTLL